MSCTTVLKAIDALNERYLDVLEELCNIESPTADKARVDEAGAYIARWGREQGFEVEVRPMEGAGDPLCITMNPEAKAAPVVLSGHIDTVHPVGLFSTPAVRRDDTKMYGPGVLDCKGGVVAAMLAMEALPHGRSSSSSRPTRRPAAKTAASAPSSLWWSAPSAQRHF